MCLVSGQRCAGCKLVDALHDCQCVLYGAEAKTAKDHVAEYGIDARDEFKWGPFRDSDE